MKRIERTIQKLVSTSWNTTDFKMGEKIDIQDLPQIKGRFLSELLHDEIIFGEIIECRLFYDPLTKKKCLRTKIFFLTKKIVSHHL